MPATCEYCHSACEDGALKCLSCGAPMGTSAPDFRYCPHCRRRLLALGSPACNYCGKALPANYVKARDAMWQRIKEASDSGAGADEIEELEKGDDDALKRALKALFKLDDSSRRK